MSSQQGSMGTGEDVFLLKPKKMGEADAKIKDFKDIFLHNYLRLVGSD